MLGNGLHDDLLLLLARRLSLLLLLPLRRSLLLLLLRPMLRPFTVTALTALLLYLCAFFMLYYDAA